MKKTILLFLLIFSTDYLFAQTEIVWKQQGRSGIKYDLAFSQDGEYVVSANGKSGALWLIDSETGKISDVLYKPESDWWSVSFSPDGNYIVAGGNSSPLLVLWDISTKEVVREFSPAGGSVYSTTFSPDGQYIASGHLDNTLKVWNASTGELMKTYEHDNWVYSVAYSPDGKQIVSGSAAGTIRVWDISGDSIITSIDAGSITQGAKAIAVSPNGELIASGGYDNKIKIWDFETGQLIKELTGHNGAVRSVSFSPDGAYLISGSDDFTIKLWEVESGNQVYTFAGHQDWTKAVFSPDGNNIVSGGGRGGFYEEDIDHTIKLWNVDTNELIWSLGSDFSGHDSQVSSIAYSPNGQHIVSGGYDKTIKLWNAETGNLIHSSIPGHAGTVNSLNFPPTGNYFVSAGGNTSPEEAAGIIKIWETQTGELVKTFDGHDAQARVAVFSPDGNLIASGSDDGIIKIWEVETGNLVRTYEEHTGEIYSLVFSPDGRYIASGGGLQDWQLRYWEVETGNTVKTLSPEGERATWTSLAFSPSGESLLATTVSKLINIDVSTGERSNIESFQCCRKRTSISFSPDSNYFALGRDEIIRIYDTSGLKMINSIEGVNSILQPQVAWSPVGNYIASGNEEGSVFNWKVEISNIFSPTLVSPSNEVTDVALTPVFSWDRIDQANKYQLQISKSYDFSDIEFDKKDISNPHFSGTVLESNTTYYWKARAYTETDTSVWSEVWSFKTVNDPNSKWGRKADFPSLGRVEAVGFSINNKGYIGTGWDGVLNNDLWEYNPDTNNWIQKADFIGGGRGDAVGFSIGNKAYLGTGFNGSVIKDFWEYDPETNSWWKKADFGGAARRNAIGLSIDDKGYIGLGKSGSYFTDFWEYIPDSDSWVQKADFPGQSRERAIGFSVGNRGYVGFGWSGETNLKDFWEYNPETDSWIRKKDFGGAPRNQPVGFSIAGKGYVLTGVGTTQYADLWEYDPKTNTWIKKEDFPGSERESAVGFSIGNKGYISTGWNGTTRFNDFWEYAPEIDTTSTSIYDEKSQDIPNLYELSQNYPNPFNPTTQIRFGLPINSFVKLEVFNMVGQKVSTVVNERKPSGWHEVTFDASNLASGIYIYRIQAANFAETKKLVLIK